MPFTKSLTQISKTDVALAGGKGASLGEMNRAGLDVPPGFVLVAGGYERFIEETGLKQEINAQLAKINKEDINSVDRAGNILRDAIDDTGMPEELAEEILSEFDDLCAEFVAVRSSATAEDSEIASWAGELDTFLNTTKENLIENIKKCWASLFTSRAIFYRFEKELGDADVSVAVVIQKMIQSEVSGICFTVHPVTEDTNQMIIEAGFGLGEAIVSGQITPDSYIIDKTNMSISDINIGNQTKKLIKSEKENQWIELDEQESEKQKLSGKQIIELAEICKKIEDHYGFPCDIEWAYDGQEFYITQSRPITTLST